MQAYLGLYSHPPTPRLTLSWRQVFDVLLRMLRLPHGIPQRSLSIEYGV